ncbi:MAG: apolipoprotein N-acyltransferase [Acuticoccus sp.]
MSVAVSDGAARGVPARLAALVERRGWRLVFAVLGGAGLAFAFPPFDFIPALVAFSLLLALLEFGAAPARRPVLERALVGAGFGFGFHLMGLWWVGAAFLVEAERYAVLLPLAVVGLPLLLAPFTALAAALAGLAPPSLAWRALALALALSASEWLRSFVLTGFPWNAIGFGLTQTSLMAQSAAVVGVNGLAIAAVLLGALPAALCERRSRWLAAPVGVILAAMAAYGAHRLLTVPATPPDAALVRIVQPNVPQDQKWEPAQRGPIWQRLLALTRGSADAPHPDIVLWPETAIPFLYRTPSLEQTELAEALAPASTLVTGAAEYVMTPAGPRTFNTVTIIGPDGTRRARYDKVHLVPFGEYVPLAGLLTRLGFSALAAGGSSFAAGTAPTTLATGNLPPFQPLICYEVIFPHVIAPAGTPAARWIVNVTNDAWFGNTPGPRQHLRHAELRAVERGLPVARAANTGISAMIDTAGRPVERLALGETGAITVPLPAARATLYARVGDAPLFAFWLCYSILMVVVKRRER